MHLIQDELSSIAQEWNTYRIRPSSENPGGVPDVLYFLPEHIGLVHLISLYLDLLFTY